MKTKPLVLAALLTCCGKFPSVEYETCAGVKCAEGSQCIEDSRSTGESYAACAIGGVPDPKCGRDVDKMYCEGNTWFACRGHYRTRVEDCAERFCVEHGSEARCVPSREPDPRCEGDGGNEPVTFCQDESAIVTCIGPWARSPIECRESVCGGDAGSAECR
jgi:hypothetical protein